MMYYFNPFFKLYDSKIKQRIGYTKMIIMGHNNKKKWGLPFEMVGKIEYKD